MIRLQLLSRQIADIPAGNDPYVEARRVDTADISVDIGDHRADAVRLQANPIANY
jgi:hypothetical protein